MHALLTARARATYRKNARTCLLRPRMRVACALGQEAVTHAGRRGGRTRVSRRYVDGVRIAAGSAGSTAVSSGMPFCSCFSARTSTPPRSSRLNGLSSPRAWAPRIEGTRARRARCLQVQIHCARSGGTSRETLGIAARLRSVVLSSSMGKRSRHAALVSDGRSRHPASEPATSSADALALVEVAYSMRKG